MSHSCLSIGLLSLLLVAPLACNEPDSSSKTMSTSIPCVSFASGYNANSQIAEIKLTNHCGGNLNFSEAWLQFSGAKPQSSPWGQNPSYVSWMNWEKIEQGFHYKKDPGATWIQVALHDGDSLEFKFNASGKPENIQLSLGSGAQPTPPVVPVPNPQPEPQPQPEPRPEPIPTLPIPTPNPTPNHGGKEIVAYYQSWSSGWASDGKNHNLAALPPYITTVLLSFARPETSYHSGQNSWAGTGMDFSSDFNVVRDAIRTLKSRNPGTKVLLSVGGATYVNWGAANPSAIAALVRDLGADGADIDYEPSAGSCSWGTGGNSCPEDAQFIRLIRSFRAALPRPYMLTTAAWSTGAFGTEQFPARSFAGNLIGSNFGLYINPLKAAGSDFDAIYIMSYDAGGPSSPSGNATGYSAKLAFEAYRMLYKGPLMLGVEVPPEAWGGHVTSPQEAQERAEYVMSRGGQGMMIWSIQKAGNPSASAYVQSMCRILQLQRCDLSLPGQ